MMKPRVYRDPARHELLAEQSTRKEPKTALLIRAWAASAGGMDSELCGVAAGGEELSRKTE
jgi:hypothetical protein